MLTASRTAFWTSSMRASSPALSRLKTGPRRESRPRRSCGSAPNGGRTIISPTEIEHIVDNLSCDSSNSCPSSGTVTVEDGALAPPSAPPSPPISPDLKFLANFSIDNCTGKARMRAHPC